MMNAFALAHPQTVEEAGKAASRTVADMMAAPPGPVHGSAVIKAGGTDLLDLLKEGLLAPETVVSLSAVRGLDDISDVENGSLRIGAMATVRCMAENDLVRARYPALAEAAMDAASPQIRAVATVGGNLLQRPRCWYFRAAEFHCLRKGGGHCFALNGENRYHAIFHNSLCAIVHPSSLAVALVALGAMLEISDSDGVVRRVPLEGFFVLPDQDVQRETALDANEIVTSVVLPPVGAGVRMAYLRLGERAGVDWPIAEVAVVLGMTDDGLCTEARIILGAVSPAPYRATAAEAYLTGCRLDVGLAAAAAVAGLEGATPLSGNAYKLPLVEALLRRAILKAAGLS